MKRSSIFLISLILGSTALAQSQLPPYMRPDPNRITKNPGKQGYPKEQSAQMLDAEVKALLDGVLRLYREPRLFTDRQKLLETLGVKNTMRTWGGEFDDPNYTERRSFTDTFAKEGLFARPSWMGVFKYGHGKTQIKNQTWHGVIEVDIDPHKECINSRAVEGYIDLPLKLMLYGRTHIVVDYGWHEPRGGSAYLPDLATQDPSVHFDFWLGCFKGITMGKTFLKKDVSDENIYGP